MNHFPEIYVGQRYFVDNEIYTLSEMRVTAIESASKYITSAFFLSENVDSLKPRFEEKIDKIIGNREFEIYYDDRISLFNYHRHDNSYWSNKKAVIKQKLKNASGGIIEKNEIVIILNKMSEVHPGYFIIESVKSKIQIGGCFCQNLSLC